MKHFYAFVILFAVLIVGTLYSVSVSASTPPTRVLSEATLPPSIASENTAPRPVEVAAVEPEAEPVEKEQSKPKDVVTKKLTSSNVPFYSQFTDISASEWKKVGCGIASLAMVIDYYKPAIPVDTLLEQGIASGAYLDSAGWTYKGLINIGKKYGLNGTSYDLAGGDSKAALATFESYLSEGPVIASVHYQFDPASTIPHLVVINKIEGDVVYYNDPAALSGGKHISVETFMKAWKKRFIVIRPA